MGSYPFDARFNSRARYQDPMDKPVFVTLDCDSKGDPLDTDENRKVLRDAQLKLLPKR